MGYPHLKNKNIILSEVVEKYNELGELQKTAKFFSVSSGYIRNLFIKNNIQYNKKKIHTYDGDFFSRDTEEAFYWAGFIAADGNISKKGTLKISLAIKDQSHIAKFKEQIKTSAPIFITKQSNKSAIIDGRVLGPSIQAGISFRSKKIAKDLQRFGIVSAKTYIYNIPEKILEHKLFNHFLRGYFDGDGCFSTIKARKTNAAESKTQTIYTVKEKLHWSICGTEKFINQISKWLITIGVEPQTVHKQKNIYRIHYNRPIDVYAICNSMYNLCTVSLDRKYEIGMKAELYYNEYKESREFLFEKRFIVEGLIKYKSAMNFAKNINCDRRTIRRYMIKFNITKQNLMDHI